MSRPFINSGVSQTSHLQLLGARPAVRLAVRLSAACPAVRLATRLAARLAARLEGLASMRIRFQAEYGIQHSPVRVTCGRGKREDIKEQAKDLDSSK